MLSVTERANDDVLDLLDYVWERLQQRMDGLSEAEWVWRPAETEAEISIRWRLEHITELLTAQRNWTWLGLSAPDVESTTIPAQSAASVRSSMATAYDAFRSILTDGSVDLAAAMGPVAGQLGSRTRRSFVLHIADELIHHGAEAALLRDLYAAR